MAAYFFVLNYGNETQLGTYVLFQYPLSFWAIEEGKNI